LIMPMVVPVTIFGASAIQSFNNDMPWIAQLAMLGAFTAGSCVFSPWLAVAALNITVGD